jgi:uncharacterized phage-associated protein
MFMFCSGDLMPYDARAVANYFLDYGASRGRLVTIMSLLKIIFFAHAWHLAKTNKPLVGQPFEAWQYGPVSRVVYDQFKHFGDRPIESRAMVLNAAHGRYEIASCSALEAETSKLLANIFDYYSNFHPYRLSDLTHVNGSPWDDVWNEATRRAVPGMVIAHDSIRDWFQRNPQPLGRKLVGPDNDQDSNSGSSGAGPHQGLNS